MKSLLNELKIFAGTFAFGMLLLYMWEVQQSLPA